MLKLIISRRQVNTLLAMLQLFPILCFFFDDHPKHGGETLYDCSIFVCANPQFFHSFRRMSFHFSVGTIVEAATSVTDQKEEDDIDLISDSPWADAKLSEVMLSSFSLAS